MKSEYKKQLIKDLAIAIVAWVVFTFIFYSFEGDGIGMAIFTGLFCAGIPFGWKWLSNIITAVSLYGIALKVMGSLLLGFIALPVIIIKDIINYVQAE